MIRIGKKVFTQQYHSPCGDLLLASCEDKLCLCGWLGGKHSETKMAIRFNKALCAELIDAPSEVTKAAACELDEYFSGRRTTFDTPLLMIGTDFQKSVWNALLSVSYGTVKSYGELAEQIGNPKAVRAVGAANGANSISIFIPCHRIIGKNHSLTGYAGGLEAKKYLLKLEKVQFKPSGNVDIKQV